MADHKAFEQNFDESRRVTPGQILKDARKEHNLSDKEVAKKLRLSRSVIQDIENDRYEHFSALIYLHGYLRSYARLVEVPIEKVMKALEAIDLKKDEEWHVAWSGNHSLSIPIYAQPAARKSKALKWISLGVLAVLILLVVLWWHGQQKDSTSLFSNRIPTEPLSNNQSTSLPIASKAEKPNLTVAKSQKNSDKNLAPKTQHSHQAAISAPSSKQHQSLHPNYLVEPASQK